MTARIVGRPGGATPVYPSIRQSSSGRTWGFEPQYGGSTPPWRAKKHPVTPTKVMDDGQTQLWHGHVLDALRLLPAESVSCCVTSPPYWSLRAYGTDPQVWGGDAEHHEHEWTTETRKGITGGTDNAYADKLKIKGSDNYKIVPDFVSGTCPCGAWRGELGHESTPQMFVEHLVEVFREVKRVLKPSGTLWINLGDSYAGSGKGPTGHNGIGDQEQRQGFVGVSSKSTLNGGKGVGPSEKAAQPVLGSGGAVPGLRAKSLVLIPERFALAMAEDGWIVRSRIAWCKRAPMPESVTDRPTSAWEHIWMFTKSARYFWDQQAVREEASPSSLVRISQSTFDQQHGGPKDYANGTNANRSARTALENFAANPGANMRNYWLLSPDPSPEAHFATFPRELVRRCIAAGTSERGECPRCGKPWVRTVTNVPAGGRQKLPSGYDTGPGAHGSIHRHGREQTPTYNETTRRETTGWAPSCACDAGPPIPQTVLDPFVGSGTTTMVARSMLRRSIGIDLSETYLRDIALKKNAQMALMPEREASA